MKLKTIYYLNGTHWDREWYKSFQGFRYMLMDVLDEVIDTLEKDPDFQLYILDGQTAVLDDYLEISPQQRPRLEKLIRENRIAVGPWYTMPDEFLPSGESLIRNLLTGHKKAREYGAASAMKYGYICDIFGHIAQLPQLLAGFGIHGALIQRGCNQDTCPPHFRWRSPDGTECLVYRTPEDFGYGAFYHYATEPYNQGWDKSFDSLMDRAVKEIDREAAGLNAPFLVLDDALDHQHITKAAPWLAKKLSEHYGCRVVFQPLDQLVRELELYRDQLPVKEGELAETSHLAVGTNILLTYILSSRYDIKQANDQTQTLWEKWAEPLAAIHSITGRRIRPGFRRTAYLELMRNHAHDSLCGCSVEEVHRDMHYRFRQASAIAEEIIDDCLRQDVAALTHNDNPQQMIVRLYHPLPYQSRQTIRVRLCFERNFPSTFSEGEREYERKPNFELRDKEGNTIPYTLCSVRHERIQKTPTQYVVDYADICFTADLTPCGYTEYAVIPADKTRRVRYIESQCVAPLTAQNRFLRLTVEPDGTVSLIDRRTGREFRRLLSYMDDGEIGDGWMHIRPAADSIVYSEGSPCRVEKLYDGPAETAFRITTELRLPKRMSYEGGGIRRSEELETVSIAATLRLGADNPYVEVETMVDNTAMDHRLKVLIPTDTEGDTYLAGQAFTLLTRPVGGLPETGDWKEPQYGDRNFDGIAAKRDASGEGLAFLSEAGLHEVEAIEDEHHTLAVTLYRGFAKTVGTNDYDQMDGQLLQKLTFRYRIMPLTVETTAGELIRCRDELQAGIRQYTALVNSDYPLGESASFMELTGDNLLCSIIKTPEDLEKDTVVVRVYNCGDEETSGALAFGLPVQDAFATDLLEEEMVPLPVENTRLPLSLGSHKILTVRVRFWSIS